MAIGSAELAALTGRQASKTNPLKVFLRGYFYTCMSMVMAALAVWGFSRTVDARLLHANPPRPLLLWFHGTVFSAWIVLFIAQSALVRVRKISVHRTLGWLGASLAATMVVSGFIVSVIMLRFDMAVLHLKNVAPFLSILWCDMIIFGTCMALAIYFRKRPEYHRRLVFHDLFYPALDVLVGAGMLRDLVVDGRVHRVYLYVFPAMLVLQGLATYLERINPSWWQGATLAILGR